MCFYQDFYLQLKVKNWFADKLGQSAAVTIVAQEGTLPLTVMLFNRFPTYFILTNILIVPLSNLLIILGSLVLLVFPIQFLSQFLASVLSWLTGLTELLTAKASSLPLANIENIGMTTVECILFTATIFAFTIFLLKKQSFPIKYPLILLTLFAAAGTIQEISTRTSNELIVYNTPGFSTIGIRTGRILTLYTDTTFIRPEVLRHCASLGLKIRGPILIDKPLCTKAGEKKILISDTLNNNMLNNILPDMIILTGYRPEVVNNLSFNHSEKTLVVTARAVSGYRIPYKSGLSGIDSVHIVRKAGAFLRSI